MPSANDSGEWTSLLTTVHSLSKAFKQHWTYHREYYNSVVCDTCIIVNLNGKHKTLIQKIHIHLVNKLNSIWIHIQICMNMKAPKVKMGLRFCGYKQSLNIPIKNLIVEHETAFCMDIVLRRRSVRTWMLWNFWIIFITTDRIFDIYFCSLFLNWVNFYPTKKNILEYLVLDIRIRYF